MSTRDEFIKRFNRPTTTSRWMHEAIYFLCDELDRRDEVIRRLERDVECLAKMLHDEAPIITRFANFLAEWVNTLGPTNKSKLQLIAERIVGYDNAFADWERFKLRFQNTMEEFEKVMKGTKS